MSFEDLANSTYLLDGYVTASDAYEAFHHTGDFRNLDSAVGQLCQTMQQLGTDLSFWTGLGSYAGEAERNRALIKNTLSDLDELLDVEYDVLRSQGVPPASAFRLVTDVSRAITGFYEWPDAYAIETLRREVTDLTDQVCSSRLDLYGLTTQETPEPRRLGRIARAVGGGVDVVAGAATAAANVAATLHGLGLATGLALASVQSGWETMRSPFGSRSR